LHVVFGQILNEKEDFIAQSSADEDYGYIGSALHGNLFDA